MAANVPPRIHLTRDDVAAAADRLDGRIRRTPVMWVGENQLSPAHPGFWLKLESLQITGAFKARGALNSLLSTPIPDAGVCTASGGNHGQAVGWAARLLDVDGGGLFAGALTALTDITLSQP